MPSPIFWVTSWITSRDVFGSCAKTRATAPKFSNKRRSSPSPQPRMGSIPSFSSRVEAKARSSCSFFACAEHFCQIGPMWHRVDGVPRTTETLVGSRCLVKTPSTRDTPRYHRSGPKQLKLDKETTPGIVRWPRVHPRQGRRLHTSRRRERAAPSSLTSMSSKYESQPSISAWPMAANSMANLSLRGDA